MQKKVGCWLKAGTVLIGRGLGFALLLTAISAPAWAFPVSAPEMDPGLATSCAGASFGRLAAHLRPQPAQVKSCRNAPLARSIASGV